MVKRKSSDAEFSDGSEASDVRSDPNVSAPISKALSNKNKPRQEKDDSPKAKKRKTEAKRSSGSEIATSGSGDQQITVHTNPEGENFLDLGKKKRAVVRSFKGIHLLDIREYYGAEGQEKPGKKGISLTIDQWKSLREGSNTIDKLFDQQKQK
jgi:hypothetical protein